MPEKVNFFETKETDDLVSRENPFNKDSIDESSKNEGSNISRYLEEDSGENNKIDESEDYLINEITDLVDKLMFKLKDKIKQDKKYKKMLKNIKKFKGEF